MANERQEVGVAYINKSKQSGEKYVKISLTQAVGEGDTLLMFPNKNKKSPKHPDYKLILSTMQKTSGPVNATKTAASVEEEDGLPFL